MSEEEFRYDREPETCVQGFDDVAWGTREEIVDALRSPEVGRLVAAECYPGVTDEVESILSEALLPDLVIHAEETYLDSKTVQTILAPHATDDRVRGVMYYGTLRDLVDGARLGDAAERAVAALGRGGRVLIAGFGASLVEREARALLGREGSGPAEVPASTLVYCDLARWEAQLRYRSGGTNHFWDNPGEDPLKKNKLGFFIEWRLADKIKADLLDDIDYYLDSNVAGSPKMVSGEALRSGLRTVVRGPFRLVPYFDPGVWGGQWMKRTCGLDESRDNYAWSFDGVPEENSLYFRYGHVRIELPAMNAVLYQPRELLGERNYSRFGAEFPIRFDLLDTMDGQNLSLQVHPLTEYIKSHFGMTYTQDESYYILDCQEGAGVYLGLREGVDRDAMMGDLRAAQDGGPAFPAERYVNRFPAKRHDHFLIPAGTVHCSSAGCMVLEISATPYIFTFKLWDWGRLGMDGLPRPIHIDDGERNIQWDRTTGWVEKNLVNRCEVLEEREGYREERTGLHELEFIETRRLVIEGVGPRVSRDGVHMLNLVEGTAAYVESPDGAFEPFEVHYAETFVLPAAAGDYVIRPAREGERVIVMQAFVR